LVLLEYQAMTYLRDVAHNGVLCTFSNRSALGPGHVVWGGAFRAGGMDRPSRTKSHPAALDHSPPASQAGRRVESALYLAFGLIGRTRTLPWWRGGEG
jgi:hypothetical protein